MDVRHAARLTVAGAVAVALSLTACGPVASPEETERNGELVEEVAAELRKNDAYDSVEASYVDNVENQAKVYLEIRCQTCKPARAVDEAVSLVWLSEITPLLGFNISVSNLATNRTKSKVAGLLREEDELTREYGERPVPSLPEE